MREALYVCVYVNFVRVALYVCVYACIVVSTRSLYKGQSKAFKLLLCVCVRERERERVSTFVCLCVCMYVLHAALDLRTGVSPRLSSCWYVWMYACMHI